MPVYVLSVIARATRPPIISAWEIRIILVAMAVIITVWIIRFIIGVGRSNPYAMKSTTIVNPNGASAKNNQKSY